MSSGIVFPANDSTIIPCQAVLSNRPENFIFKSHRRNFLVKQIFDNADFGNFEGLSNFDVVNLTAL